MIQIFRTGLVSHIVDHNTFEVMTSTYPIGTPGLVTSFLAATICIYNMGYCRPFIYGVNYFGPICN